MRIAVTGGTGFVGRAVCAALLERGCEVVVLSRSNGLGVQPGVDVVRGDLFDPSSVDALVRGADAVVNAAGLVRSSDEVALRRTNVDALVGLLDRCEGVGRVVHLSTAGVHGRPGGRVTEESPFDPANAYEASKADAERALFERRPAGSVAVRPTNIVGVGHPLDPLERFLRAAQRGRVWAGSDAWVNYVGNASVAAAVAAATLSSDPPPRLVVNDPRRLVDFSNTAAHLLGVRDRTHVIPSWVAGGLRLPIRALGRRVPALHRVGSLLESTRFETEHEDWFAARDVSRDVAPTLRAMVDDYRARGKL